MARNDPHRAAEETTDLSDGYRGRAPAPRPPWDDPPAGMEQQIRTRGKWLIISGAATGLLTIALAVVWDFGFGHDMPLAYVMPLYAASFGAISLGCREFLSLPNRRAQERCIQQIVQVRYELNQLVGLMDEELQQRFYRGIAAHARDQVRTTGTENARPLRRAGDVVQLRRQD